MSGTGRAGANGRTTIVWFTRDLRVHDHPALVAAVAGVERVVPVFVLDEQILTAPNASPNRAAFLADCLAGLRANLRALGSDLVVRRGRAAAEIAALGREVGATDVVCSADVSSRAAHRTAAVARACAEADIGLQTYPGVTIVPPGELTPAGGDHYRVFTPYWRAWDAAGWRQVLAAPRTLPPLPGLDVGRLPGRTTLPAGPVSPRLARGGETEARRLLAAAARRTSRPVGEQDDLAADATSRLSPYLHFGCVSALEVAGRLRDHQPDVVRQLAWRDFHHQVTAAFPEISRRDYRERDTRWRHDPAALEAWRAGRTGVPIVDAGMRQLTTEGWMHNRARLITASFLTKNLRIDWREGAAHFFRWLVDGDVANNHGNWQWVAGTGNDTRPNRVLSPLRQARRFDPDGEYVRRHVPELAAVPGRLVHTPRDLPEQRRRDLDYPPPLVEL